MKRILVLAGLCLASTQTAFAQLPPAIGYAFPSGGQAGKTVEVLLGGYDWTPDMQIFVHDPRVKLEIIGTPGPVIVPEPPYWFGKKARRSPFLLPRETKARLTIPADVPPGLVKWQVANANGATATGKIAISQDPELAEIEDRDLPQELATLPVVISGRIKHIEEVDRYKFTAAKAGPITCSICAREIDSPLNAVLEVYDAKGQPVVSSADTAGNDTSLTFAAEAGGKYRVDVYDLDFRGNRSFVYRLRVAAEPRVIAAFPPVGKRGETREVEFIGYGIVSGQAKLESLKTQVAFPADKTTDTFHHRLKTAFGETAPFELHLSDLPETLRPAGETQTIPQLPAAISGILDERFGEHRFNISAKKGDLLYLEASAKNLGSRLDVSLAVYDSEGVQKGQNDDLPGSTDAALEFRVPADGEYQIGVSDVSGHSGNRAAVYRLVVKTAEAGISFTTPELLNLPLGGTANIALKAVRSAGFKEAVAITVIGLPEGVTVPADLSLPAGKVALSIALTADAKAAATASLVRIVGEAKVEEQTIRFETDPILVATTIKPPFAIDAEGKDDVTKWPRGTIFPAPVLIERDEGFTTEIMLEMASRQGRHRQGICGPELPVPNGVQRILYPVTLPEWLETTRTSRMSVNGVAKVADPKGNLRYSVSRQKTRMGFLPTGALLKLSADVDEFSASENQPINIPLSLSRSRQLKAPALIELRLSDRQTGLLTAESQLLSPQQQQANFLIKPEPGKPFGDEQELTIRATVMQDGNLPVISETKVLLQFRPLVSQNRNAGD